MNLNDSHYQTLRAINRLGACSRTRLANECNVSRPAAWRTLDRLIKLGLVRVVKAPFDQGSEHQRGRPEFKFELTTAGAGALMNEINKEQNSTA